MKKDQDQARRPPTQSDMNAFFQPKSEKTKTKNEPGAPAAQPGLKVVDFSPQDLQKLLAMSSRDPAPPGGVWMRTNAPIGTPTSSR